MEFTLADGVFLWLVIGSIVKFVVLALMPFERLMWKVDPPRALLSFVISATFWPITLVQLIVTKGKGGQIN